MLIELSKKQVELLALALDCYVKNGGLNVVPAVHDVSIALAKDVSDDIEYERVKLEDELIEAQSKSSGEHTRSDAEIEGAIPRA